MLFPRSIYPRFNSSDFTPRLLYKCGKASRAPGRRCRHLQSSFSISKIHVMDPLFDLYMWHMQRWALQHPQLMTSAQIIGWARISHRYSRIEACTKTPYLSCVRQYRLENEAHCSLSRSLRPRRWCLSRMKNQHLHWMCWVSLLGGKNGLM